jgi:hypothetical protein
MSKSDSVFVVMSSDKYDPPLRAAFHTLDEAKDYVLSNILLEVLNDFDPYVDEVQQQIVEMAGDEQVNTFEPSCEGYDYGVGKVTNVNKLLGTLDLRCVTFG